MKVLITGAAGFIGYHLSKRLIGEGYQVVGLDNLNNYYSINLKYARLNLLGIGKNGFHSLEVMNQSTKYHNFSFIKRNLSDSSQMKLFFERHRFDVVINLAAQVGVRYSLKNPRAYTSSNVDGFLNILEGCKSQSVKHLIYASSSSVYGLNSAMPFEESDRTETPASLYAATKKSNELMAHTYAHLYGVPSTGLRFFTVYGPLGRPDMAYFLFAKNICSGKPINIFNHGNMARDFTYIDDIVESIFRLIPKPPAANRQNRLLTDFIPKTASSAPHSIFNIGNGKPVNLLDFINILEDKIGIKTEHNMIPMQPGDVEKTWANTSKLHSYIQFKPVVNIHEGISRFVDWYRDYYGIVQKQKIVNAQKG